MRRIVMSILVAVVGLAASIAVAQDARKPAPKVAEVAKVQRPITPEAVDKVKLLLSGYDYFPTREDLERATPRAYEVLFQIASDEAALPSARTRALDALGLFDAKAEVAVFLETSLAEARFEGIYLRHAVTSSMKAFGPSALPWVTPYLNHQDLQLRLSAIHAVGHFGGDDGKVMLREVDRLERDQLVKSQIKRFVR